MKPNKGCRVEFAVVLKNGGGRQQWVGWWTVAGEVAEAWRMLIVSPEFKKS